MSSSRNVLFSSYFEYLTKDMAQKPTDDEYQILFEMFLNTAHTSIWRTIGGMLLSSILN
jgi:Tfp pilus assembly protein PilZ